MLPQSGSKAALILVRKERGGGGGGVKFAPLGA